MIVKIVNIVVILIAFSCARNDTNFEINEASIKKVALNNVKEKIPSILFIFKNTDCSLCIDQVMKLIIEKKIYEKFMVRIEIITKNVSYFRYFRKLYKGYYSEITFNTDIKKTISTPLLLFISKKDKYKYIIPKIEEEVKLDTFFECL